MILRCCKLIIKSKHLKGKNLNALTKKPDVKEAQPKEGRKEGSDLYYLQKQIGANW